MRECGWFASLTQVHRALRDHEDRYVNKNKTEKGAWDSETQAHFAFGGYPKIVIPALRTEVRSFEAADFSR